MAGSFRPAAKSFTTEVTELTETSIPECPGYVLEARRLEHISVASVGSVCSVVKLLPWAFGRRPFELAAA